MPLDFSLSGVQNGHKGPWEADAAGAYLRARLRCPVSLSYCKDKC
jgi:hypothetical protein